MIAIGGLETRNSAARYKNMAYEAGVTAAFDSIDEKEKAVGKLLVEGRVIHGPALFQ